MDRCSVAPLSTDAVWATVDQERRDLADLLETLSDAQWDTPSLCEGWRVREVAAHLTLAHTGPGRAVVEAVRARGSFDAMIRDTALRRAATPRQELVGALRAMVGSRRRAPGLTGRTGPAAPETAEGRPVAVPRRRAVSGG